MPDTDPQLTHALIRNFGGLRTNADPQDLQAGESVVQVNCGGPIPGKLRTRPGLQFVDFAGGNGGTAYLPHVVCPISTAYGDHLIYQRSDGAIILGTDPA
jgi:hypothetical protein